MFVIAVTQLYREVPKKKKKELSIYGICGLGLFVHTVTCTLLVVGCHLCSTRVTVWGLGACSAMDMLPSLF